MGATLILVSCVSTKRQKACAARDLYSSPWFTKARRYVEEAQVPWCILSAKHGLLQPDSIVSPYDQALHTMPVRERRNWAERVAGQLALAEPNLTQVVMLAGSIYREFLTTHLTERGVAVATPMQGLAIGEQLRWLTTHRHGC